VQRELDHEDQDREDCVRERKPMYPARHVV